MGVAEDGKGDTFDDMFSKDDMLVNELPITHPDNEFNLRRGQQLSDEADAEQDQYEEWVENEDPFAPDGEDPADGST